MFPTILVRCFHTVLPAVVLAMLPALMRINRVVAMSAGLEGKRGIEAALVIAGGIVIPEVIVVVVWSQEEVVSRHDWE